MNYTGCEKRNSVKSDTQPLQNKRWATSKANCNHERLQSVAEVNNELQPIYEIPENLS